jgi:tetratricopeptide (TPR) repeat protein
MGLLAGAAAASVEGELAFHRGVVAYGEGRYDEAQAQFEAALAADPEDASALQYLGLIARARRDAEAAVGYLRRAAAADPDDPAIQEDLAGALLSAGRSGEAREVLKTLLAHAPDRGRAQLYAGIAAYRERAYADAIEHFDRAAELDEELRLQARYYAGLCQAFLGDLSASAAAFASAEEASPSHPLARSARSLRRQVEVGEKPRTWSLALSAGGEYDTNATVIGDAVIDLDDDSQLIVSGQDDYRGVFRAEGEVNAYRGEHLSLDAGYQGFVSLHADVSEVDQNTQVAWGAVHWLQDPVRLGVRYDFAYTWLDLDQKFRRLQRLLSTVSLREASWAVTQLFYEFQEIKYFQNFSSFDAPAGLEVIRLDRDGEGHTLGINQFFFPAPPVSFLRLGGWFYEFTTDGDRPASKRTGAHEFDFDGFEVSTGTGLALPWDVDLTLYYVFGMRDYTEDSIFKPGTERLDYEHRVSVEITRPVWGNLEASLAGSYTRNRSNVDIYDYERLIGGAYLTYRFQ